VEAIREVLPKARVGGPESTGVASSHAEEFLRQFLEHCAKGRNFASGGTGAPLDFISFHPKGRPSTVMGKDGPHVRMDIGHQLRAIDRGMRVVASYPEWKNTPIVLGESDPEGCAACKGPENGYRNGPLYGVSVAEATARTYELARKNGVTVEGSVTWAFEFENQPYFAGFRELATNGVDKPVLNVFRMMGMLSGDWLEVKSSGAESLDDIVQEGVLGRADVNAVATRDRKAGRNQISVLVWNYHDDDVAASDAAVNLMVDGLAGLNVDTGKVEVEEFRMDGSHSNAYAVWQKMGSPEQPTDEQQRQLESAGGLQQVGPARSIAMQDGAVPLSFSLPRQGVALIRLSW
jgi:xylan 1,4-beta-xylosidase